MKLKQFLAILLVFALCITLVSCSPATNETSDAPTTKATAKTEDITTASTDEEKVQPLLYKVTDDDGNTIWLFGSIHVGRDEFYPLPDYVMDAFEGSESLAVEFDLIAFEKDTSAQIAALTPLIYTDGTTISDHIPEELYEKCVELFEDANYYNSLLDYYIPAMWSLTLNTLLYEELGVETDLGVDRHLLKLAKENDMEILDIESATFQYQMFSDFSEELQILLLEETVEMYSLADGAEEEIEKLLDLWQSGDADALAKALAEDEPSASEKDLYKEYNKAMITDRNRSMTDFAEDALESGDEVFICVGAAHIVGEGAMADLLAQRGYEVTLVK